MTLRSFIRIQAVIGLVIGFYIALFVFPMLGVSCVVGSLLLVCSEKIWTKISPSFCVLIIWFICVAPFHGFTGEGGAWVDANPRVPLPFAVVDCLFILTVVAGLAGILLSRIEKNVTGIAKDRSVLFHLILIIGSALVLFAEHR